MASLGSYLPSPGKVAWRLDAAQGDVAEGNKVRHVMIRSAEVWEQPTPHVMYKVEVLTENDHWYLYRRYSQFHTLHRKLIKLHAVSRDLLPPKRYHGNLSKSLIDQRRLQLESYLQKLIHSEAIVSQSDDLCQFLDVPSHDIVKVTDILTRYLYGHGDDLLMEAKPVALSVNEMYSITKRLRLPFDALGVDTSDPAADPAHLYSFLHQLQALRVCLPPPPTSVCCMPFELSHFRSLKILKLDKVPLTQVSGLLFLQQQISKLTVMRTLRTVRELLIESVEEKRSGGSPILHSRTGSGVERWRVTATAKLTENRIVVQPWHSLHTLVLSHNKITHFDDSLQILPALRELNLSHNTIQVLELPFLCVPSLEKLNLSHNAINKIVTGRKVLETVTSLNLSHNRLHSLDGIASFVSMASLNLNYNLIGTKKNLNRLVQLRRLKALRIEGNPVSAGQGFRLLMLAKFVLKSREILLDGEGISGREQTKIRSYRDRYGEDPDLWPLTQSVITQPDSSSSSNNSSGEMMDESCDHPDCELMPRPPSRRSLPTVATVEGERKGKRMARRLLEDCCASNQAARLEESCDSHGLEVSWQVHAPGDYRGSPISRLSNEVGSRFGVGTSAPLHQRTRWPPEDSVVSSESFAHLSPSFLTTQLHQGKDTFPDESIEEGYAVGSLHSDLSLLTSREEPDGQSERLEVTPPTGLLSVPASSDPPSLSITNPPPTPQMPNGNYNKPRVTPAMVHSALEALQQIEDKQRPLSLTPHETLSTPGTAPIFSEAVASALSAWISQQNSAVSANTTPFVSPPPSTPLEASTELSCRPISASDLIAALSALIPSASLSTSSVSSSSRDTKVAPSLSLRERGGEWKKSFSEGGNEGGEHGNSLKDSNPCSVPATTPQEGLEEWFKLGIRPEEVIQALSALTIQDPQRVKSDEQSTTLSPITEERPSFTCAMTGGMQVEEREEGEGESGEGGGGGFAVGGELLLTNSALLTCDEVVKCEEERGEGGGDVVEKGGGEEEGEEGQGEAKREGQGDDEGEGEGEGEGGGQRGVLLTWDSAEVTEITLGRNRTTDNSNDSTRETRSSLEDDVGSSRLPSADVTDSENSVFSPEPLNPSSHSAAQSPLDPLSEVRLVRTEQRSSSLTSGFEKTVLSSEQQRSEKMPLDRGDDSLSHLQQGVHVCVKECPEDVCMQSKVSDAVKQAQTFGYKYEHSTEIAGFGASSKAYVGGKVQHKSNRAYCEVLTSVLEVEEDCKHQKKEDLCVVQTLSCGVGKPSQLSSGDTAQESKQEWDENAEQRVVAVHGGLDRGLLVLSSTPGQEVDDVRD